MVPDGGLDVLGHEVIRQRVTQKAGEGPIWTRGSTGAHRIVAPKVAGSSSVGHPTSRTNRTTVRALNRPHATRLGPRSGPPFACRACIAILGGLIPITNAPGYVHRASGIA